MDSKETEGGFFGSMEPNPGLGGGFGAESHVLIV
jgi:hypothetical protein